MNHFSVGALSINHELRNYIANDTCEYLAKRIVWERICDAVELYLYVSLKTDNLQSIAGHQAEAHTADDLN